MNCELCCDNDCLDLPSLTQIHYQERNYNSIFTAIGYIELESIACLFGNSCDKLDIPNLTEDNIHCGKESFGYAADLHATSNTPSISIINMNPLN